MSLAVLLILCSLIAVASQEKSASNIRLVRFVATLASKENNEANSTNTIRITSLPPVASKFSFKNATALTISMKSKDLCKKRLSGVIFGICKGCFYHEHEDIQLEKIGRHIQKDNKKGQIIPWSRLNGTVMLCCSEKCGFADFKKLCCDGGEFRKTKN